jgi:Pseudouridylate synthases, 23S RNA-specific
MSKPQRKGHHSSKGSSPRPHPFPRQIEILYEDDAVIAVNKPAGLLAVPVKDFKTPSALSVLSAEFKSIKKRVFVVHRIDRYTSGILLFAKTERDREPLVRQFLAHTPARKYLAVIRGHLDSKKGTLIHYFRREGMYQKLSTEKDRRAAQAELRYSVQRTLPGASLVEVTLVTGLQNQIRVQFLAISHPVIGDRKYSPQEASEQRIHRVALHASHLEFVHPRSNQIVSIDCEAPADFRSLLDQKPQKPQNRS